MKRLAGRIVLLADDEFYVRLVFAMMLDGAGAAVTQAQNGTQALEVYLAGRFDCVVTDCFGLHPKQEQAPGGSVPGGQPPG